MDGLISLGPYYNRCIGQVRQDVERCRARGQATMIIGVTAPITAPMLEVMVETHALYVIGFRALSATDWWEFDPEETPPLVPAPKRRIVGPPPNYTDLGLDRFSNHRIAPWKLLEEFVRFDGKVDLDHKRKNVILLIFLVSEALRFDSMQGLCYRYVANAERYFQAPDFYYRHQDTLDDHNFDFDQRITIGGRSVGVREIVRNWRTSSTAGAGDPASRGRRWDIKIPYR